MKKNLKVVLLVSLQRALCRDLTTFNLIPACHLLGDYLESIKKDFSKAAKVYKNNCDDHNYGKSCLKYAKFLLTGKSIKEDYKDGYNYLEKACNQNEPDACFHQGLMLLTSNEKANQPYDVLKACINSYLVYLFNNIILTF